MRDHKMACGWWAMGIEDRVKVYIDGQWNRRMRTCNICSHAHAIPIAPAKLRHRRCGREHSVNDASEH